MNNVKNWLRLIPAVALLWITGGRISARTEVSFSNVGARNGMSSDWVTALCQDRDGFVWIGTNRGLNRFDGHNMTVFEARPGDTTSLTNNTISCIREDLLQNLWVGTSFGINIRHAGSLSFRQISLFNHNAFGCNDLNNINDILISEKGTVYIGTHQGFFTWEGGLFRHHLVDSLSFSAAINNVLSFAEDHKGNIWMGTSTHSIVCYEPKGTIKHISLPHLYEGKYVNGQQRLFADSGQLLWIGSQSGMYVYDLNRNAWHDELNMTLYRLIGSKLITGIQEDKNGRIWVATDGAGIFIFDKEQGTTENLLFDAGEPGSLSSNGLYCLLIGRDQMVWAGTYKHGLDFYKPGSRKFRLIQTDPKNKNSLNLNDVDCVMEDSHGRIWIGTNGGGINILDRKTGKFNYIRAGGEEGLSSDIVVSLYEDHHKDIWIGTYFGGLNRLDHQTGKITVFKHKLDDPSSLSDDRIWSIAEDAQHNLWIGTLGGGLNLFQPETETFKCYAAENSNLAGNYINHLSIGYDNRLWVCTSDGLSVYDQRTGSFESFINPVSDTGTNTFGSLISAFKDSRGWQWLCGTRGLIRFDPVKHKADMIDKRSGLLSNSVYRMLEDKQGNLWVSSSWGISKISIDRSVRDTSFTMSFVHFDEADGLQGIEFSETTSLKTKEGEMIFGGVRGLNIFRPEEIVLDTEVPPLIFTNLRIFNTVIDPGTEFNRRVILNKFLNHTDEIVLKHAENLFSVEFAALTFLFPEKSRYRYKLEGFDEGWFETDGTANFATFTNLNHGDYILRVIGSNADGIWNTEGISLKIKILPPFFKTWYAMLIYIFVITMALLALRYMILFRERMKVELDMERSEARRLHEMDMLKLKFFTNVSHEFLTPLTLIFSPVEKLLSMVKDEPEKRYLDHIYQNTKKLRNMVVQLLDFRKMEGQGLSFNPSWGDIVAFIRSTVAAFVDLSENRHIELRLVTGLEEFYMMFDRDKIERTLFNLLSNAFKYTPVSGLVIVLVELEPGSDPGNETGRTKLIIRVKDNGTGIHPANLERIFDRFYQEENPEAGAQGTGIGLSLAREYVQLHGGTISVESALHIGTCFRIVLPAEEMIDMKATKQQLVQETKFPAKACSSFPESGMGTARKNKPSVLIVEDNDDLRLYLRENLEDEYDVLEAENGMHALHILDKTLPDLIITDIMMPGMDGIEFCRRVKSDKISCHIPLIFLTAKVSEIQELDGLRAGADDYVTKPFNLDILLTKAGNLIRLKQNIRDVFKTKTPIEPKDISITSLDEKFIRKAFDIIEEQMGNERFSVNEFSKQLGISRMQLYNKLVSLTGSTPLEFIRTLRLKRAAQLLEKSQMSVSEIAYQVGFNDPRYFSIMFKKEFGTLPSMYKTVRPSASGMRSPSYS
ncbi:MAG: two-component regulator propeller domain-containing protein [Mangrovibacterium sp.]